MNKNCIINSPAAVFAAFCLLGYVVKFYPTWLNPFDESSTRLIRSGYPFLTDFFPMGDQVC